MQVCLGVVPVKVQSKEGGKVLETYALLDSGSEVTLCQEQLSIKLGLNGQKSSFKLTGMTGTKDIQGELISRLSRKVYG